MSLQVWLPLNGNIKNYGLCGDALTSSEVTFADGGKIGAKYLSGGTITIPAAVSNTFFNKTGMSFAFWLYPIGDSGNGIIMGQDSMTAGNNRMYSIFQYSTPNHLHLSWQDETSNSTFGGGSWSNFFSANVWTHCCITYNGSVIKLYKNGILYTTVNAISQRNNFNYNFPIRGNAIRKLNDVRIYDHCLSTKEVKELSKGLILHYPLNREGFGQENLGTRTNQGTTGWSNSRANGTYSLESVKWLGVDAVKMNCEVASTGWKMFTHNGFIANWDKYKAGGTYVLSYDTSGEVPVTLSGLMNSDATNNVIQSQSLISNTILSNKQHYEYRIILKDPLTKSNQLFYFANNLTANTSVKIANLKFEEGSIATRWCPASTDVLATNLGLNDLIEYDTSGYCNNGTKVGTFNWTTDTIRYDISTLFDGTTSGIIINNLALNDLINNSITYSFWVKPNGENGARSVYFGSYNATSWSIEKNANNLLRLYWNGSPDEICSGATITDGIWQHICITKNGSNDVKVYINGQQKWSSTAAHNTLTFPTTYRIGRDVRSGDGTPYKGLMSDFRIYATVLSAEDIKELYETSASIDNKGNIYAYEFEEV